MQVGGTSTAPAGAPLFCCAGWGRAEGQLGAAQCGRSLGSPCSLGEPPTQSSPGPRAAGPFLASDSLVVTSTPAVCVTNTHFPDEKAGADGLPGLAAERGPATQLARPLSAQA